ncbi:hypothetical protein QJS66_07630 [Kocuria rhizophila]|nr:hypothetical protein QJS66_07630 [Kocuria rhizophila]
MTDPAGAPTLRLAWRGSAPTVLLLRGGRHHAHPHRHRPAPLRPPGQTAWPCCPATRAGRLAAHGEDPVARPEAPRHQSARGAGSACAPWPARGLPSRGGPRAPLGGRPRGRVRRRPRGLLTPFAPPASDSLLLRVSPSRTPRSTAGGGGVSSRVVGSQLLWDHVPAEHRVRVRRATAPVFLGQLHGAELRAGTAPVRPSSSARARGFPGRPGERTDSSRAQHAVWRARGLAVDRVGDALAEVDAPVGSVFSTGCARGRRARSSRPRHAPRPAALARGLLAGSGVATAERDARRCRRRAGRHRHTRAAVPAEEPARAVARILRELAGGVVDPSHREVP